MDSIKIGDLVTVHHSTEDCQCEKFTGIVKHIPSDIGDSWEIHGKSWEQDPIEVRRYQQFGHIRKSG